MKRSAGPTAAHLQQLEQIVELRPAIRRGPQAIAELLAADLDRFAHRKTASTSVSAASYPCLVPAASFIPALPWPFPVDASAHGPALDRHLLLNLWIALALLALAHLLLLVGLFARRRTSEAPANHLWRIEYLPLTALALLFAGLTIHAERLWAASRYTGADPAAMQVEVDGVQFAWYFRYPGADATFGRTQPTLIDPGAGNPVGLDPADSHGVDDFVASELVLPANREVDLHLRAQDVIHGFSVPEMRLKQNAVPGQIVHLHFTPTTPGTYAILCTQLCGLGHFRMQANLRVLPPAAFAQWLASHAPPQPGAEP